jgi:ribonuclease HI
MKQRHDVRWHWVKGHSGHEQNEIADQLWQNKGIGHSLNMAKKYIILDTETTGLEV